eukprot:Gregarina_sp_Poly_1__7289@NODE_3_length_27868_cov_154_961188_g2_i0_p13_GENE_NODE_3_length_27868_cov_154_961188_g2_i0NODE_3_length_27868_cov_154_961188_g2_i0_p13_ORF_typecomplete_len212_score6_47Lactamase_B_2/PF12706_7/9_6e18Lactamase_B/PF00753_27/2_4e08Lactamase_B_6/PF16661_5/4_6e05Lactamase_B_3/PF13483_6/0_11zfTFIIB/PF13453_6/0_39_NODE_3_length_27868_cov_154_961188_g2_i01555816193
MNELILLGTGPSCGLPQLNHVLANGENIKRCGVCHSIWTNKDKPDRRYNVCALLRVNEASILIDMGKTCRQSMLDALARNCPISPVNSIILTHDHADAIGGLDDLREFKTKGQTCIPIYASQATATNVKQYFPWLLPKKEQIKTNIGQADFRTFETVCSSEPMEAGTRLIIEGVPLYLIPVHHGSDYISHGFVFGKHFYLILNQRLHIRKT